MRQDYHYYRLANIFLIFYGPGTLLAVASMKYFNLKKTMLIGGLLTALGALLRLIGTLQFDRLGPGNTYIIVMAGQALSNPMIVVKFFVVVSVLFIGALGQPIFVNLPPALAAIWFPFSERDISTTVGAMFSPIGNAVGQLIPVIIVSKTLVNSSGNDDDGNITVSGMSTLMAVELALCAVPLLLAVFLFRDRPPTPPSNSTSLKAIFPSDKEINQTNALYHLNADNQAEVTSTSFPTESEADLRAVWEKLSEEASSLCRNKNFIVLFIAFAIGVGFFNALMTMLYQIVAPHGYSNDDAGTFGAVFIACGLLGAGK